MNHAEDTVASEGPIAQIVERLVAAVLQERLPDGTHQTESLVGAVRKLPAEEIEDLAADLVDTIAFLAR